VVINETTSDNIFELIMFFVSILLFSSIFSWVFKALSKSFKNPRVITKEMAEDYFNKIPFELKRRKRIKYCDYCGNQYKTNKKLYGHELQCRMVTL